MAEQRWLYRLIVLLCVAVSHAHASDLIVDTRLGSVQGLVVDGVAEFLGIPYAKPPVGELRWRPPQAAEPWSETFTATEYGHACPQAMPRKWPQWLVDHVNTIGRFEDCLTLNVWSQSLQDRGVKDRSPVLVYIHGGTYRHGVSSSPRYHGAFLAQQGFVVVTINYRIGLLGRFAYPAMSRVQAGEPLANYGTMDQILALEWVRDNIAAFGGDPENVTIFGHSAGGVSVNSLMVAPAAKGLFHRAIAQGSGIMTDSTRHISRRYRTGAFPTSLEDQGVATAREFGIDDNASDAAQLAALRAIPADELAEFLRGHPEFVLNPVVDGEVIPDGIAVMFEQGLQHDVPYIGGINTWESNLIDQQSMIARWFIAGGALTGLDEDDLALFDDQWTRMGQASRWFQEGLFMNSTRHLLAQMENVASPAWYYRVNYLQENLEGQFPGAPHGLEVPFLFGNVYADEQLLRPVPVELTPRDIEFADNMRAYWLNFARNGSPNGDGLPEWPAYTPANDTFMDLGAEFRPVSGFEKDRQDYLDERALIRRANR